MSSRGPNLKGINTLNYHIIYYYPYYYYYYYLLYYYYLEYMGKTISLHLNKNRKVSGIFIYLFIIILMLFNNIIIKVHYMVLINL